MTTNKKVNNVYKRFIKDLPMANKTSIKVGGKARYFFIAENQQDLCSAIEYCRTTNMSWFLIGNGSNIIIDDKGYPGLIISLSSSSFNKISISSNCINAGAGALLPAIAKKAANLGLSGFEFMCDIPGTVGGAIYGNAGTKDGEIKDVLLDALVLDNGEHVKFYNNTDFTLKFRNSILQKNNSVVLSASFKPSGIVSPSILNAKIKKIKKTRKNKQPQYCYTCGSFFKNPSSNFPAGWLIDQCGLKGYRVGDAMVSYEHANWLINVGAATYKDFLFIADTIKNKIYNRFNVILEREVLFIPDDLNTKDD